MTRIDLLNEALSLTKNKFQDNPNYFILKAIISQLEYLLAVASGRETDFSSLENIIIGRITAHDIDNLDSKLAEILYLVADEARKMNKEYGS